MSRNLDFDQHPALPESARLLGYNRDVGFFLSDTLGLVFVVQGDVVWTLRAKPRREDDPELERSQA